MNKNITYKDLLLLGFEFIPGKLENMLYVVNKHKLYKINIICKKYFTPEFYINITYNYPDISLIPINIPLNIKNINDLILTIDLLENYE